MNAINYYQTHIQHIIMELSVNHSATHKSAVIACMHVQVALWWLNMFHKVTWCHLFTTVQVTLFPQLQAHHKNSMQLLTYAWKKTKSFIAGLFNLMKVKGVRAKVARKTRPPVSPHLTLLDIFMWGYVDNSVCSENICNWHHLQGRIYIAVMTSLSRQDLLHLEQTRKSVWCLQDYRQCSHWNLLWISKSLNVPLHTEGSAFFFYICIFHDLTASWM